MTEKTKPEKETVIVSAREYSFTIFWWLRLALTLGLYFFWWQARKLIVTNRRVVLRSGVFGKSEHVSMGTTKRMVGSYATSIRYGSCAVGWCTG